jgi:hypothetical protein
MAVVEAFKRAGFANVSKVIDTYDFFGKHVRYRMEIRHDLSTNRYVVTILLSVDRDEDSLKQRMEILTDYPHAEKETYEAALGDALDFLRALER